MPLKEYDFSIERKIRFLFFVLCKKVFHFLKQFQEKGVLRLVLSSLPSGNYLSSSYKFGNFPLAFSIRWWWSFSHPIEEIQLSFQDWRIYCIEGGKNAFTRYFISFGKCLDSRDTITDTRCCKTLTSVIQMYFVWAQCICKFNWFSMFKRSFWHIMQ